MDLNHSLESKNEKSKSISEKLFQKNFWERIFVPNIHFFSPDKNLLREVF
jgi:hypothetical protein